MEFYTLSDNAILQELGERLRTLRLRKNISQQQLATATRLALNTIKALETGQGKLASLIAVLRELGALQQLDNLVPDLTISPLQLAKQQGKQRARASGARGKNNVQRDNP